MQKSGMVPALTVIWYKIGQVSRQCMRVPTRFEFVFAVGAF